jgi:methylase of polypeptide subunit release factors
MYQKFSTDLSTQKIYASGNELATMYWKDRDENGNKIYTYPPSEKELVAILHNPVLITDHFAVMKQITDYAKNQTVMALINKQKKTTEYDWFVFTFDQNEYPTLRWPNQDTLFFCRYLRTLDLKAIYSCLEICTWSGFIGQYLAYKFDQQEQDHVIWYNDINNEAYEFYQKTVSRNHNNSFMPYDWVIALQRKKHDLILCNPPYIPRKWSVEDNAYEWLELAQNILKNLDTGLTPNGKLLINFSSLSMEIMTPIFEEMKANGRSINYVDSQKVPLKVLNTLNNETWIKELEDNKWLMKEEWFLVHQYRHTINLLEIKRI